MGKSSGHYPTSFPCKQGCRRSFRSESERGRHNGLVHQTITQVVLPSGHKLTLTRDADGLFHCTACPIASPDPADMRPHVKACPLALAAAAAADAQANGGGAGTPVGLPFISSAGWGSSAGGASPEALGPGGSGNWGPFAARKTVPGAARASAFSTSLHAAGSQPPAHRPPLAAKQPFASQPAPRAHPYHAGSQQQRHSPPSHATKRPAAAAPRSPTLARIASTSTLPARSTSKATPRLPPTSRRRPHDQPVVDARSISIYRTKPSSRRDGSDTEDSHTDDEIIVIDSDACSPASAVHHATATQPSPPSPTAPRPLKRKHSSSLPTPGPVARSPSAPPTGKRRRSRSPSALGSQDGLFGSSGSEDGGGRPVRARPHQLDRRATRSYPSPSPSARGSEGDARASAAGGAGAAIEVAVRPPGPEGEDEDEDVVPDSSEAHEDALRDVTPPPPLPAASALRRSSPPRDPRLPRSSGSAPPAARPPPPPPTLPRDVPPEGDGAPAQHSEILSFLEGLQQQALTSVPASDDHARPPIADESTDGETGHQSDIVDPSLGRVEHTPPQLQAEEDVGAAIEAERSVAPRGLLSSAQSPEGRDLLTQRAARLPASPSPLRRPASVRSSAPPQKQARPPSPQVQVHSPPRVQSSPTESAVQSTPVGPPIPSAQGTSRTQQLAPVSSSPAENEDRVSSQQHQSGSTQPQTSQPVSAPAASQATAAVSAPSQPLESPDAAAQLRTSQVAAEPATSQADAARPPPSQQRVTQLAVPLVSNSSPEKTIAHNSSGNASGSSRPKFAGTSLRTTPPPPIVVSSQSDGAVAPTPQVKPRLFPQNQTPWFYYAKSIRPLLASAEPQYGRLGKLALRVQLLIEWRPLLIEKIAGLLAKDQQGAGRSKGSDVVALRRMLRELRMDEAEEDIVEYAKQWLIRTQLIIDPQSANDQTFFYLVRGFYPPLPLPASSLQGHPPTSLPPLAVGAQRAVSLSLAVSGYVLQWRLAGGHIDDLPDRVKDARLTCPDPADPSSTLEVNPAPWSFAVEVLDPPCQRVARAWRLLHENGLWDFVEDEVEGEAGEAGLVDSDGDE